MKLSLTGSAVQHVVWNFHWYVQYLKKSYSEVLKMPLIQIGVPGFYTAAKPTCCGANRSPVTSVWKMAKQISLV